MHGGSSLYDLIPIEVHSCNNNTCCENMTKKPCMLSQQCLWAIINAGYFIQSGVWKARNDMSLGTFLANFANLTCGEIPNGASYLTTYWSIFNLDKFLSNNNLKSNDYCQKMSSMDKFLQNFFKELGQAIGFSRSFIIK